MTCPCPSPSPSPSCSPWNSPVNCDLISMYLGEKYLPGNPPTLKLYYTKKANPDDTSKGHEDFIIPNYDCSELIEASILPSSFGNSFDLTERELLSSATFEGWIAWCVRTKDCTPQPFGIKAMNALGFNLTKILEKSERMFQAIRDNGDTSGVGVHYTTLISDDAIGDPTDRANALNRLTLTYEWFREIYTNYYGRKFLIRIGDKTNKAGETTPFKGVCVKDDKGDYPNRNFPFAVYGDGNGQGLYVSDQVSGGGGYPGRSTTNILGLKLDKQLDWVVAEDGKIQCFIKFGNIVEANQTPTVYNKLNQEWVVDSSKLDNGSFYIQTGPNNEEILYVKADIEDVIYFTDTGQYVLVNMPSLVPLKRKSPKSSIYDAIRYFILLRPDDLKELEKHLTEDKANSTLSEPTGGAPIKPFGARGNSSQLNLLKMQEITVLPAGACIPMKSNIFSYGPYYHNANNTGGTEIIVENTLAPWNFSKVDGNGAINIDTAYTTMDCIGKALAKDGAVGLQQLEKGRLTVASWPAYSLGHSVDAVQNGPTLLTDISVDYGGGGITTTYNFETYTPRFGRPGQHILDSWSESIKQIQETNRFLKEERLKSFRLNNQFKQQILNRNDIIKPKTIDLTPKFSKAATPNRLLISGFYVDVKSNKDYWLPSASSEPDDPITSLPYESPGICDPCAKVESSGSPAPTPMTSNSADDRIYAFSEAHVAYQGEFVQNTYSQLSIMSLDGLFLPVSISGDNSKTKLSDNNNFCRVPRFAMKVKNDGTFSDEWDDDPTKNDPGYPNPSSTRYSMPPFETMGSQKAYALPIHQMYLNPILSTTLLSSTWTDDRKNGTDKGFVISSIAYGDDFDKYSVTHTEDDETERQQYINYRFSALRGPLVLQGWGYDTNGKPIPNAIDSIQNAQRGKFKKTKLTDKFMKNWIQNPRTWPVGPIDLRWDRERGVWVAPPSNKIVVARLKEELLPNGKAQAELINPVAGGIKFYETFDLAGPNGENLKLNMKTTLIEVYDFLGVRLCPCDIVYAYYDDNRYIVLESSRTYGNVANIQCAPCTTTTTVLTTETTPPTTQTTQPTTATTQATTEVTTQITSQVTSQVTTPTLVTESLTPITETPSGVTPTLETPTIPTEITEPTPVETTDCWVGLGALKTIPKYDPCKTQALIHKDGCLQWEDIVQCDAYEREQEEKKEQECRDELQYNQFTP